MEHYCEQGDQQDRNCGQQEGCKGQSCVVGEDLQPFVHEEPGHGECYETGEAYEEYKIPGEEGDDLSHTCSQHLPDADLFLSLLGGKCNQPQEAQAGDQDGKDGKCGEYFASFLVGGVL